MKKIEVVQKEYVKLTGNKGEVSVLPLFFLLYPDEVKKLSGDNISKDILSNQKALLSKHGITTIVTDNGGLVLLPKSLDDIKGAVTLGCMEASITKAIGKKRMTVDELLLYLRKQNTNITNIEYSPVDNMSDLVSKMLTSGDTHGFK